MHRQVPRFASYKKKTHNATAANRSGLYPAPITTPKYLMAQFFAFVVTKLRQNDVKNVIGIRYFIR